MADTSTGVGCGCKYCRAVSPLITKYFIFEGNNYKANLPLEDREENMFIESGEKNLKIRSNDCKIESLKVKEDTFIENFKLDKTSIKSIFCHCVEIAKSNIEDAEILTAHLGRSILKQVDLIDSELNYVALQCATLIKSKISGSCFQVSNFSSSSIKKSQILETDLSKANFQNSEVTDTYILNCDITESNFTEAEFNGVTFKKCNLSKANLGAGSLRKSASFNNSRFIDCDLSEVDIAVIGVDRIDLSKETTIGKKLPESVSDYKRLEDAYRRIEKQSREKGISKLHREAKILKKKSKRKRNKLE